MTRSRSSESGQAAAEFAIAAPALFLVLFGLMMVGYTFGKQLDLKGATRDGARRGAVSWGRADGVAVTQAGVRSSLGLSSADDVTITVTPPGPWEHGQQLTVRTSTPHRFEVMGVTFWQGTLRAESQIRVE